ncbi:MAG: hypothetical protein K2I06_02720 [Ruminococcus sp.]|nr:hypothetical protein [Ruminococcus sp.]
MSIETFQTLSIVFYTLAGVLLLTAVILFFVLGIPKAFGIYTGLSAARGIKKYQDKIQQENTVRQTGKVSMTSPVAENTEISETSKINADVSITDNHTVILKDRSIIQDEPALPVENPNTVFAVIQELSFMSSAEFIE